MCRYRQRTRSSCVSTVRLPSVTARHTRWAMIAVGLGVWFVARPLPGMHVELLLLSGALVAWATFGLLAE